MKRFNNFFAYKMTLAVSTMWAFYLFVIYGLIPVIFPTIQDKILYWSNFVQLIFLPLLAVGGAVMAEKTEKRDEETHATVMESHNEILLALENAKEERQELAGMATETQQIHQLVLEEMAEVRKVIAKGGGENEPRK